MMERYFQVPRPAGQRGDSSEELPAFAHWILRPYVDLGPAPRQAAAIHTVTTELAAAVFLGAEDRPFPMQINTESYFRALLQRELGAARCALADPRELPPARRTPPWQQLCDRLDTWPEQPDHVRARVGMLLNRLGFFACTRKLLPPVADAEVARSVVQARILQTRVNAIFKSTGPRDARVTDALALIARCAPDPAIRLNALIWLIVHCARIERDHGAVAAWSHAAEAEFGRLSIAGDTCAHIVASAYHRALAFLPFLDGRHADAVRIMESCEDHARAALAAAAASGDAVDEALARENMHPALETSARVAEWLGDRERVLACRQAFVAFDPGEPKGHIRLGDTLLRYGDVEAAARAYLDAAQLGIPFAARAWFMVGSCRARLGDLHGALQALLHSAASGPLELSTQRYLGQLAEGLGHRSIAAWSREQRRVIYARARRQAQSDTK